MLIRHRAEARDEDAVGGRLQPLQAHSHLPAAGARAERAAAATAGASWYLILFKF